MDADVEGARLSRVTSMTLFPSRSGGLYRRAGSPVLNEELICVTPCVVDLRQGAHTFVFTSPIDPTRTSKADVLVSAKTTFVRHALGRQSLDNGNYGGGAVLLLLGGILTVIGGGVTTAAAAMSASRDESSAALGPGLVVLGLGVATGLAGWLHMRAHRPFYQPGSTTQW